MDQRTDTGDEQGHRDRQRIDEEADIDGEVADRHPLPQGLDVTPLVGVLAEKTKEHGGGRRERSTHRHRGDPAGTGLTEPTASHEDHEEPE